MDAAAGGTWSPAPATTQPQPLPDGRTATAPAPPAPTPAPRTVTVVASFAADGLEGPLLAWLEQILGIEGRVAVRWAPYSNVLEALPALLAGPARGGAELVVVLLRLEDLAISHPELRHAPVTKDIAKTFQELVGTPVAVAAPLSPGGGAGCSAATGGPGLLLAPGVGEGGGEGSGAGAPQSFDGEHIYDEVVAGIIQEYVDELRDTIVVPELEMRHRKRQVHARVGWPAGRRNAARTSAPAACCLAVHTWQVRARCCRRARAPATLSQAGLVARGPTMFPARPQGTTALS